MASDFFQRQDEARRNTGRLIFLFGLAVLGLSIGTYIALAFTLGARSLFDPFLAFVSLVCTGAFIFIGSAFKTSSLSQGGSVVAESLGGEEVDPSNSDPLIRRYVNVVEEMSLASGVPCPRIYVLQNEPGINGFAAGYSINDAAIAVTRGCLEKLTRDELQAVVAHEYSHILNGDMRLNIRLIGVVHGILLMYLTGRVLVRLLRFGGGSRGGRGGGGVAAIGLAGLALMVFGYGGVVCGRLIKSAVSRQREYLADAAAVQFTRNPMALAGALRKIGGHSYGSGLQADNAEEVSHMCFGSVRAGRFSTMSSRMFSTHPPLIERIRRLDPKFSGDFAALEHKPAVATAGVSAMAAAGAQQPAYAANSSGGGGSYDSKSAASAGGAQMGAAVAMAAMAAGANDWSSGNRELQYNVKPEDVVNSVGEVSPERLVYCASLIEEIPRPLTEARSSILGAMATVYTLLLDNDLEERRKQGALLQQYGDEAVVREAQKLWGPVFQMEPEYRLPLLDLLLPTLRRMTVEQFRDFSAMVDRLIMADGQVVLKEFIIEKVLMHRLEMAFNKPSRKVVQFSAWAAVLEDVQILLSCLAHVGHDNINVAAISFAAGKGRIPGKFANNIRFLATNEWTFSEVDVALDRLAEAAPQIKRAVVDACAYCVMGDGVVTVEEVELLRAICESLDVPLPPFIPEATRRKAA